MYPSVDQRPDGERDLTKEAIARRLRALRSELPPPFDWSELQRRSRARARAKGGSRTLAIAAVLALVCVVAIRLNRGEPRPERTAAPRAESAKRLRPSAPSVAAPAPELLQAQAPHAQAPHAQAPGSLHTQAPAELLARADTAERWLASEPESGPIVQVSTHLAVTHLEDRIASMDDLLNLERLEHARPSRLRTLQLERAQLVDSLAQVRYAEILASETP